MTRPSVPLAVACVLLVTAPVLRAGPPIDGDPPPMARPTTKEEFAALAKAGPLPPWMPFRARNRTRDVIVHGTVTAVSAEFIEVRTRNNGGTFKYPPHTLLATGAVCHWLTDCDCYLLDDVKVGDVVTIGVGVVDEAKDAECF